MTTETRVARARLSERVGAVPPSGIRKFFDVIATMPDVISLGVGEPDFTTPPQVVEEGVRSLRSGRTHYTSNYGTIELRRALSTHLERLYGLSYNPETEICVTVGASEAVAAAMCPRSPLRPPCRRSLIRATRCSSTSPLTLRTCRPFSSTVAFPSRSPL